MSVRGRGAKLRGGRRFFAPNAAISPYKRAFRRAPGNCWGAHDHVHRPRRRLRSRAPSGRYRWLICALLFLATTVNYIDRQVLALIKGTLDTELGWTNAQYGAANSAFQGAYAISLFVFGWFIDRFGVKIGYAVSIAAWSLAAAAHALVGSARGFMIARAGLGLGEGGNFPSSIKAVAHWFPRRERAFATSLFNSGANVGAIVAPAIIPPIAAAWGWRAAFVFMGIVGMAWLLLWLPFYDDPEKSKRLSRDELDLIRSDGAAEAAGERPIELGRAARLSPGVVVHRRQADDRSGLVVLPHLAARLLQEEVGARHQEELGPPGDDLRDHHRAQHRRRLADRLPRAPRLERHARAQDRDVHLRVLRAADLLRDPRRSRGRRCC